MSVEAPETATAPDVEINNNFAETGELIQAIPAVLKETKSGYRTTEFWLTIITALTVLFTDIPLPDDSKGFVLAGLAGVYAVARALAKKGIPDVPPQA